MRKKIMKIALEAIFIKGIIIIGSKSYQQYKKNKIKEILKEKEKKQEEGMKNLSENMNNMLKK